MEQSPDLWSGVEAIAMGRRELYGEDLARIHIDGYGFHWKQAAPAIMKWLRAQGIKSGLIVDLGCGGGEWLEHLASKGYEVCGVDVSRHMIRAAKRRAPAGRFICGSFAEVDLPPCDAVTSLGEPICYLDSAAKIRHVFRKVHRALRPGGVFIFDMRVAGSKRETPRVAARVGDDWACIATMTEDGPGRRLTRDITTFRKVGKTYRRDHEVHRLTIVPKGEVMRSLRKAGFRVKTYRGYGKYGLGPRQVVIVGTKALRHGGTKRRE